MVVAHVNLKGANSFVLSLFKNNNYDFQTKDISVLLTTRSR